MLKKKQNITANNSILQLGRNTVMALGKKSKKTRNMQISSIYSSNSTIGDKKMINMTASLNNYKPPRHKHQIGISK